MAYQVKQNKIKCDELEIELSDGTRKTYTPILSVDNLVKEYRDLTDRLSKVNMDNEDSYSTIGAIIVQLLNVIFDEAQTKDMLETFNNKYIELLSCVFPYIENVIKPIVEHLNEDKINYYQNVLK